MNGCFQWLAYDLQDKLPLWAFFFFFQSYLILISASPETFSKYILLILHNKWNSYNTYKLYERVNISTVTPLYKFIIHGRFHNILFFYDILIISWRR